MRGNVLFLPIFFFAAAFTHATTMQLLDIDQLTDASQIIVIAEVIDVAPEWEKNHTDIGTIVTLHVSDYLKSDDNRARRLSIHLLGGSPAKFQQKLWRMNVDGLPALQKEERGMFFLEKRGPYLELVGWAQGFFKIKKTITGQAIVERDFNGIKFINDPPADIRSAFTLNKLVYLVKKRLH